MSKPYVVTIDGPSGSGKGSLALIIARRLELNFLDSGAIYRLLALQTMNSGLDLEQEKDVLSVLPEFNIRFEAGAELSVPFLNDVDVSEQIRSEAMGEAASIVARHVQVREQLLDIQRAFLKPPGLVADGRDMGTVVFPDAEFKFYLYASEEIRAQRRYKQLKNMGISASIAELQSDIAERDERDRNRSVSPLKPAEDALVVDSSFLDLEEVGKLVLSHITGDGQSD